MSSKKKDFIIDFVYQGLINNNKILIYLNTIESEEFMFSLMNLDTLISIERIKTANFSQNEWKLFNTSVSKIRKMPLLVVDDKYQNLPESLPSIIENNEDIALIVIDSGLDTAIIYDELNKIVDKYTLSIIII